MRFALVSPAADVETIKEEAKKLFAENIEGENSVNIDGISKSDGKCIQEFFDLDGNSCGIKSFLSCRGMYASKTNFYLLTSSKEKSNVEPANSAANNSAANVPCNYQELAENRVNCSVSNHDVPRNVGMSVIDLSTSVQYATPFAGERVVNEPAKGANTVKSNQVAIRVCANDGLNAINPVESQKQHNQLNSAIPIIDVEDFNIDCSKILGKGAFGQVFEGNWLGARVAVKKVNIPRLSMAMAVVSKEVNLLSRLRHPHIVQLLAIATSGNHLFLGTEFIDGTDLENLIFNDDSSFTKLQDSSKNYISLQILQGMAYMHATNIIHQDVKPANVLVTRNSFVTKLCDLGIGKVVGINGTITCRRTGSTIANPGTPMYMAPECLLNIKKTSEASDMWSAGATISELNTNLPYWQFSVDDFRG